MYCLLSEAHRGEGLGIPSPHLGCHFWRLFGVVMLPEEFFGSGFFGEVPSSLMFPYSALPWLYSVYITCVSRRYFWLLFHTFSV